MRIDPCWSSTSYPTPRLAWIKITHLKPFLDIGVYRRKSYKDVYIYNLFSYVILLYYYYIVIITIIYL